MAIGIWQPESTSDPAERLDGLLDVVLAAKLRDIELEFDDAFISQNAWVMKQDAESWQMLEGLDNQQLTHLIRFFTLAEMVFVGWQGGSRSPVIYLVAELKKRNAFEPELRKWIKQTSDNRYLPNGAAL